jgi:hypothetical protein
MDVNDVGFRYDVERLLLLSLPVDIDSKGSAAIRAAIEDNMPRLDIGEPIECGNNVAGTTRHRRIGNMNDLHCAIPRQVRTCAFSRGLFLFKGYMSQRVPVVLFDNVAPKRALRRKVHHAYAATA